MTFVISFEAEDGLYTEQGGDSRVCLCFGTGRGGVLCGSHFIKFYNGALCDSVLTRTGQESRS